MQVLLIFGGQSPEHDISVNSAQTISKGLEEAGHKVLCTYITKEGKWLLCESTSSLDGTEIHYDSTDENWKTHRDTIKVDVAFPIVHGVSGEDGSLQSYLDSTNTPYVGCNAAVSELCFNKYQTKRKLAASNIRVTKDIVLNKSDSIPTFDVVSKKLGHSLFIKPARGGSSIGVSKVSEPGQFQPSLEEAFKYDELILIESAVPSPLELEVAVLENIDGSMKASPIGEVLPGEEFFNFEEKYSATSKAKSLISPQLADGLENRVRSEAKLAAEVLGCQSMVRVDFLYDSKNKELFLNEVNTLPGFTSVSMYPKLWQAAGLSLPQLCNKLIEVAVSRK